MSMNSNFTHDWVGTEFKRLATASSATPPSAARLRAYKKLEAQGFPTTRVEEWKYTNLRPVIGKPYRIADDAAAEFSHELRPLCGDNVFLITVVDGKIVCLPKDALAKAKVECATGSLLCGSHPLGSIVKEISIASEANPLVLFNQSFHRDSLTIRVPKNTIVEGVIEIRYLATSPKQATFPVLNLIAEAGSSVSIVEHSQIEGNESLTCRLAQVVVHENAAVDHTIFVQDDSSVSHLGHTAVRQERDSRYRNTTIALGAALNRNEIVVDICGEGVLSTLLGLSVLGGEQHTDNSTLLRHAAPNSESHELYKGIYDEQSKGAFGGTIIVEKDAQKTNAIQSNQAILLSDAASIHSKPQLKIWADDVKCTHGATVGQLDEAALFYIRSRGVSYRDAKNMLIQAFAGDVTKEITNSALRAAVEEAYLSKIHLVERFS